MPTVPTVPTDSVLSWGILFLVSMYGLYRFVRAVIAADEKRYGGDSDVW